MMNDSANVNMPPLMPTGPEAMFARSKASGLIVPLHGYQIHVIEASPSGLTPRPEVPSGRSGHCTFVRVAQRWTQRNATQNESNALLGVTMARLMRKSEASALSHFNTTFIERVLQRFTEGQIATAY